MEISPKKIVVNPYAPNEFEDYCVYQGPIAGHRPIKDGMFYIWPMEYSTWQEEELSWHDNCYIHSGLNPMWFSFVRGTDFLKLLTDYSVSTFKKFPVGKARHVIFCNEEGKISWEGIIIRREEDLFLTSGYFDWNILLAQTGDKYDVTATVMDTELFFYQLDGPRSLEIVEAAAREDLHDIKFMYERAAKIAGKDVYILRTGMAGTLGYEVHGRFEDCQEVYQALMEAGEPYGITEIGRHAYRNAHTEGGIPQVMVHFDYAKAPYLPFSIEGPNTGSLPADSELLYRSPIDLGWEHMIRFDHDFIGKEALQKELDGHHNTMVNLRWFPEDILKVVATYFEEESCEIMDMAEDFDFKHGDGTICADAVYDGDRLIGASGGRMWSPKRHEMISMCTIDQDYAGVGTVVEVLWGKPGTRQMRVRAEVIPWPYITECRNDDFDVENIPHPKFD